MLVLSKNESVTEIDVKKTNKNTLVVRVRLNHRADNYAQVDTFLSLLGVSHLGVIVISYYL